MAHRYLWGWAMDIRPYSGWEGKTWATSDKRRVTGDEKSLE